MKLRLWNKFSLDYLKKEKPMCSICPDGRAIGAFYDRDWQEIKLCEDCYGKLTSDLIDYKKCEGMNLHKGDIVNLLQKAGFELIPTDEEGLYKF